MKSAIRAQSLIELEKKFTLPTVVVSGGPSLIKQLPLLKENKEMFAQDVERHFYLEQSTTSHHLNILRRAGITKARKEGVISLEKEAKNAISYKNELTAVLVSISVAKNSAELWMSKNQGGLALSEKIIKKQNFFSPELRDIGFDDTNIDGGSTTAKANPTKTKKTSIIVASDAIGAYAGFVQTAVLAPIPGANAAIAANTVFQGATASILSAISLW
jgi:DNA-binding transcriptional ArsR family regulator